MATECRTKEDLPPKISIHTTLAGGDWYFSKNLVMSLPISIHTTLAGGDPETWTQKRQAKSISIHTTLAGGD